MISCRARLVNIDETWLYHYDPETKQQSMEWRHSGSSRPQNGPSAKIRWKSSRLDFLGIKTASSSLIIFQRTKLSSPGAIEGHFEGKTPQEGHQGGLVLARQCPSTLGFQCLDHLPYSPDLAPSDYHLFPGLKKQLKGRHFSSDAEVIAAAETCMERQTSEFF